MDVGYLGRWHNLDQSMKDFDINPEEWNEHADEINLPLRTPSSVEYCFDLLAKLKNMIRWSKD